MELRAVEIREVDGGVWIVVKGKNFFNESNVHTGGTRDEKGFADLSLAVEHADAFLCRRTD
jgi:hypothetical protein